MRLPTRIGQCGIQTGSAWSRWTVPALAAVGCAVALGVPMRAADQIDVTVDISRPGATIHRNIFGQFAEHLGTGIYEGVWVGRDSIIPNTRGIRNDVVAALKASLGSDS